MKRLILSPAILLLSGKATTPTHKSDDGLYFLQANPVAKTSRDKESWQGQGKRCKGRIK